MTYATVSTGFKGGGINPRPYYTSQAYPFKPETLTNYEVGMKSDWLDHRLRANVDAFWDKYTEIQLGVSNCGFIPGIPASQVIPCLATLNAGDAVIEGAEFDLSARPFGELLLSASGSYLDFRYTALSPYAAGAGVTRHTWPDFTPKWKGTLAAQYTLPLGGAGNLTPRLDVNYQGKMGPNTANVFGETPAYTVLNAHLVYQPSDAKWQIRLEITNVANKLYYVDYNDERSATGGPVFGVPAPPREYAVSVRRSW
jgi:iron complex outermembrane receptor protein